MERNTNNDTISLLKECDAGAKMAVATIDEILERVQDREMKRILTSSKSHHQKLEGEIKSLLTGHQSEEKEPTPMAKSMSWLKTNVKLTMDNSDATVADLITDGCNMGVKSLHKYMNQYKSADHVSRGICKHLSELEENLCKDLRTYL